MEPADAAASRFSLLLGISRGKTISGRAATGAIHDLAQFAVSRALQWKSERSSPDLHQNPLPASMNGHTRRKHGVPEASEGHLAGIRALKEVQASFWANDPLQPN